VHGEVEAATKLAQALKAEDGYQYVSIPELHQSFDV